MKLIVTEKVVHDIMRYSVSNWLVLSLFVVEDRELIEMILIKRCEVHYDIWFLNNFYSVFLLWKTVS